MNDLFIATLAYLQAEASGADRSTFPPQPEPLGIYYQLKNFNTLYLPGGLANQPAILVMELNKVIEAKNHLALLEAKQLAAQIKGNQ